MTFSTILPNLYGIELPTPFEVGTVNVYLAKSDPLTLIDCGISSDESYSTLADGLAELGCQVRDIQRILITHHHVDHIGLAGRIAAESGAVISAHPYAVPWLENPIAARRTLTEYSHRLFRMNGVPESVFETLSQTDEWLNGMTSPADVSQIMDEGMCVDFAGHRWDIYFTPGHAGSLVCFYQPETKVLLASDHLLLKISSNPLIEAPRRPGEPRPKRLLDYIREMQRITTLGAQIAYSGHGQPITNIPFLVQSRLEFHQKRADKIWTLFEGQPRTLYDVTQALFPKVPDLGKFLTLSEVQGHIDILERDKRLTPVSQHGLLHWKPV
jgi:glyoxylase-like metal-dependent hydrolase (beta-lactamase superfamily II)